MDRETMRFVCSLPHQSMDALEISGSYWNQIQFRTFTSAPFPGYDVCEQPLEPEKWDIIFLEQVLEHVPFPRRALMNLHAMLRPAGYLVVTTPFFIRVHNHPIDCTRWTEVGMKYLLADSGFHVDAITTGSWGNRQCLIGSLDDWPSYNRYKLHSLTNDPRFPVTVWAFAQKASAAR